MARLRPVSRRDAYAADITYATNNELGFDYLRDNMAVDSAESRPARPELCDRRRGRQYPDRRSPHPADHFRTGRRRHRSVLPVRPNRQATAQVDRDYEVDVKHRNATLTEDGIDKVEQLAGIPAGESIYDERYIELTHYLEQALTAHAVYQRDKDYIVRDGEVIIIDEFTGRMMVGRRYSEGLHQAIEAKENVRVRRQNVTMATITFQNYFRMYDKLAGMTGTAETESEEFYRIYNLPVVTIPTNREMIRTTPATWSSRPSAASSRRSSAKSRKCSEVGRPDPRWHHVGREIRRAQRDARSAGRPALGAQRQAARARGRHRRRGRHAGRVTIATNMAGRGTDIKLGEGIADIGGLHIIGTERHESRRIDNQLRGRAGRQGDPGSSRFFVSLEDELMRRFGSERIGGLMDRLGMEEDQPIEHRFISQVDRERPNQG